jgi:hypothetical protein
MPEETATQANDVLGRECSEHELAQFEAYVDALGDDDIDEAANLRDQFPAADDRERLMEFMQRKLDEVAKPPDVGPTPVPTEPPSDPDKPDIRLNEERVAVSGWDEEKVEQAARLTARAFRATPPEERRRLEGRRLTVKDCRRLAKRAAPRSRESRPAPSRKRSLSRSSSRSADSGDDSDSSELPPRRYCENERCEADITHLGPLARYCDDGGACKQQAYRDRRLVELLDEMVGTIEWRLSCKCQPKRNTLEPGHCHQCGYPRGVVTREWVTDQAPRSRQLVVLGSMPHKPRYGDGKRKPVHEYKVPREVAA